MSTVALGIALVILLIGVVQFVAPDLATSVLGVSACRDARNHPGGQFVVHATGAYGWLAAFVSLFLLARFTVLRRAWTLALALTVGGAVVLSGRRTPAFTIIPSLVVGALHQTIARGVSWRPWAAIGAGALIVAVVSFPAMGPFYTRTLTDYFGRPAGHLRGVRREPEGQADHAAPAAGGAYAGSVAIARDEFPLGVGLGRFGSQ